MAYEVLYLHSLYYGVILFLVSNLVETGQHKDTVDHSDDNFAIVFGAMGVNRETANNILECSSGQQSESDI